MDAQVSLPRQGAEHSAINQLAERAISSRQILIYALAMVCVVVFVVYLPALSARATFHDDNMYLMENPLVRNPSWTSVQRFFTEVLRPSSVMGYYQPLTMVSLMVDYAVSRPRGSFESFHRTSLLLHVMNTALVIVLLYLLFGDAWSAAAVGLLFGIHPMVVDSVCWISERKTVLAGFFGLWSLIFYVLGVRRGGRRYDLGCTLMYVLALLSKPITVPLPLVMVLMDYWPLRRMSRATLRKKIPLFAVAGVFAAITYVSQSRTASVILPGQYNPLYVPLILSHNVVFYLYKIVWPVNLSPHYGVPQPFSLSQPMVLAGVIGTCMLIALLIVSLRWTRALLAGWLVFFVALLPAMGVLSVTPVLAANRYAYFPSIGLLFILGGFSKWLSTFGRHGRIMSPVMAVIAALVLAGPESLATRRYLHHWRDTTSLHKYVLALAPHEAVLHNGLAVALSHEGKKREAIDEYRQALAIWPGDVLARLNLASTLGESEETRDEAVGHYLKVLELKPWDSKAEAGLGNVLFLQGKYDEAVVHFGRAVRLNKEDMIACFNLGKVLVATGHSKEGIEHLKEALRLAPAYLPATKDLAWFLATHPDAGIRDPNEAMKLAERAAGMTGNRDAGALDTLAAAYALAGRYKKAVETGQKAFEVAKRVRDHELANEIEERLRLYQFECPYYENPRVQLDRLIAKAKKKETAGDSNSQSEIHNPQLEDIGREVQDGAEAISAE